MRIRFYPFEIWERGISSIRRSLEMKIAFVRVVVVQRCDIVIARDEIENTVSRVKDFKNLKRD